MEPVHQTVRPAAVAGLFYPEDAATLATQVQTLLAQASHPANVTPPKALIVPHAGYIYSGPIAASAYVLLAPLHRSIRRVVLLGPSHRIGFAGVALPACEGFATPLGDVTVDMDAVRALTGKPGVIIDDRPHAQEHALEVQLPFLQTLLDDFRIVPMTLGTIAPRLVANLLESVWGGPETLIVTSSDLSHYNPYESARICDRASLSKVMTLEPSLTPDEACGAGAINALLMVAQTHGLVPALLDVRNSGDTAGDRSRVVGYAAASFSPGAHALH